MIVNTLFLLSHYLVSLSLQNNSLQGRIHYTQFEICLVMNPRFIEYRSIFL